MMSACDVSTFGGGFQSKKNRVSQKIDVPEMPYNVKGPGEEIIESRTYKIGGHVAIVKLKPGQEVTEKMIKDKDIDVSDTHKISSFWTVLDGKNFEAIGAEIPGRFGNKRIPLRCLWPVELSEDNGEQEDE
jgi:hypothetical protein